MFYELKTFLFEKFRVGSGDFNRQSHFVNNALPRSVSAGEQFEVAECVVLPVAVDMVDGLARMQSSSKVLFHDISMFKHVTRRFAVLSRDDYSNVAVTSNAFRRLLVRVFFLVGQASEQRTAFSAAQRSAVTNGSVFFTFEWQWFAALNALRVPSLFVHFATDTAAFGRAILRQLSPFFLISADGSGFVAERLPADFAGEINHRHYRVLSSILGFMDSFARRSTKALSGVTRSNFESSAASFATFRNWHLAISCWSDSYGNSMECCASK